MAAKTAKVVGRFEAVIQHNAFPSVGNPIIRDMQLMVHRPRCVYPYRDLWVQLGNLEIPLRLFVKALEDLKTAVGNDKDFRYNARYSQSVGFNTHQRYEELLHDNTNRVLVDLLLAQGVATVYGDVGHEDYQFDNLYARETRFSRGPNYEAFITTFTHTLDHLAQAMPTELHEYFGSQINAYIKDLRQLHLLD